MLVVFVRKSVLQILYVGVLVIATALSGEAASEFDFLSGPLTLSPSAISMDNGRLTVTAKAYHVEFSENSSTIFGPFTTGTGIINNQVFGTCVRGFCDTGLGLGSWQTLGQTDTDRGGGLIAPGFDNGSQGGSLPSLQFALFSFNKPVNLSQVIVDDVSNYGRSIWVAVGDSAPDLSSDFLSAFAGFTVVNSHDDFSDGIFVHSFKMLRNGTYIAVGTPPPASVGNIGPFLYRGPGITQFYINGLLLTSPVSVSGTMLLLLEK